MVKSAIVSWKCQPRETIFIQKGSNGKSCDCSIVSNRLRSSRRPFPEKMPFGTLQGNRLGSQEESFLAVEFSRLPKLPIMVSSAGFAR